MTGGKRRPYTDLKRRFHSCIDVGILKVCEFEMGEVTMKIYELNKKNRFIFLLKICCLVFCLGMLFCTNAAAASNSAYNRAIYQKAVSYYKKGKFSKANKYFKMLKKNANESCVKKMPKAMKKAYLEVLQSYYPERRSTYYVWNYYLTDIDKDNKPELLIRFGSCEADARLIIYSYRRQFVLKIGELSEGHGRLRSDTERHRQGDRGL